MRHEPDAPTNPSPRRRALMHMRRRAQRAEGALAEARDTLARERAAIAEERAALLAYLDGPEHDYDLLLAAQTRIARELRALSEDYKTCGRCGGFTREALDALLAPALEARRDALGLPPPDSLDERVGAWPVKPGADFHNFRSVHRFIGAEERERHLREARAYRPPSGYAYD